MNMSEEERVKELFLYLKKGEMEYFDEFYELLKNKIFYNILSLTKSYDLSEDLLQETFVKFLTNIQNIDSNESIQGYLMLLSRNLTLDYFKKNNRLSQFDETNEDVISKDKDEIDKNILLSKIKKILKDKEFEIFTLHVLNELTFEEISKLIKKPVGTVLWSYNNSIKKIRKEVKLDETM